MNDIEKIEWYFGSSLKCKEIAEAWGNIKERLQTPYNSECTVQSKAPHPNQQADFVHSQNVV